MTRARFQPRFATCLARAAVLPSAAAFFDHDQLTSFRFGGQRVASDPACGISSAGRGRANAASGLCRYHPCGRSARCGHRDVRHRCLFGDRSSWSSSEVSERVLTLWVPAWALLRCQRTTRCRMSARGSRPNRSAFSSMFNRTSLAAVEFDYVKFHASPPSAGASSAGASVAAALTAAGNGRPSGAFFFTASLTVTQPRFRNRERRL